MNVRACALITTVYPPDSSSRLQFDNTIYWHTTRYDVRHCLSHQLPISAIACTMNNTKHLNLIILYVHTSRRYSAENAPLQAAKDDLPLSYIHMSLTLSTSLSTVPYAVRLDRANCMCIPLTNELTNNYSCFVSQCLNVSHASLSTLYPLARIYRKSRIAYRSICASSLARIASLKRATTHSNPPRTSRPAPGRRVTVFGLERQYYIFAPTPTCF